MIQEVKASRGYMRPCLKLKEGWEGGRKGVDRDGRRERRKVEKELTY